MTDTTDDACPHATGRALAARTYGAAAGALVGLIGAIALTGWLLDVRLLASVVPGSVTMKANTAIGFLALATALVARASIPNERLRRVGSGAALVVLAIGGLTVAEYALGIDLGIDQLVFDEFPDAVRTSHPGRMALNSALCFAVLGWALLKTDTPARRGPRPANVGAVIVMTFALQAVVGYVTGVSELFGLGPWTDMAIPTAAAFALASTGAIASRPCHGVMAVLCSDGVAGTALRRLLPTSVIGPLVLGAIATAGQRQGLMTSHLAVWLLVTLLILLLAVGTWRLVRELDGIERERITIAARHHASERRFSAMTESARDAIVIADTDGTITYANQAAHAMFAAGEAGLQGVHFTTLLPEPFRDVHAAGVRQFIETGSPRLIGQTVDVMARRGDGTDFPAQISLSTWTAGGERHYAGMVRDVTVQKLAEAELERARDEALGASRLKSAFVANMSHELRTPLNGVMGMSELLATTPLTDRQARYNETLMRSAESLLRIVNELLDFADLEAGTLALDPCPTAVRELVRQVVNHAVAQADQQQVVVEAMVDADAPETVTADPLRLRQIVMHLVGNALKFTSDGHVQLSVDAHADGEGTELLRFRVIDTGIGIDADLLAAIFAPFNQADVSSTRRFGGTGIGLTISRKLAEMMGGEVTATSEPGHGSTFTLTLPLAPVETTPAPPVAFVPPAPAAERLDAISPVPEAAGAGQPRGQPSRSSAVTTRSPSSGP